MAIKDKLEVTEQLTAEMNGEPAPPRFPCITCGKETLEHTPDDLTGEPRRICSHHACRHVHLNDGRK